MAAIPISVFYSIRESEAMARSAKAADGYEPILANLKFQKEKIEAAIAAIEALRDAGVPAQGDINGLGRSGTARQSSDTYAGLSFLEAVTKLLSKKRKPMTTSEITECLMDGGFVTESDNPRNVFNSMLHRQLANGTPSVVSMGTTNGRSLWGLPGWPEQS